VSDDPAVTLAALLHQACHALVGGGVGPSAHGRWHTQSFVVVAEMLGLKVSGSANTRTVLDDTTRYAKELDWLREAA
jgi:hypothetical protein